MSTIPIVLGRGGIGLAAGRERLEQPPTDVGWHVVEDRLVSVQHMLETGAVLDRDRPGDMQRQCHVWSLFEDVTERCVAQQRTDQLPIAPDPLAGDDPRRLQQVERLGGGDVERAGRPRGRTRQASGSDIQVPMFCTELLDRRRFDIGVATEYVAHLDAELALVVRRAGPEELGVESRPDREDAVGSKVEAVDQASTLQRS